MASKSTQDVTNVGYRETSITLNNREATVDWHTEVVNSADRDRKLYPRPDYYQIPLSRRYRRVLDVELESAEIPRTFYTVKEAESCPGTDGEGNNRFRFGEGYIIDDGSVYGLFNDRLTIREYSEPTLQESRPCCCEIQVRFPHTLIFLRQVAASQGDLVVATTVDPHNLSLSQTPHVFVVDYPGGFNGKYGLAKIVDNFTVILKPVHGKACEPARPIASADDDDEGAPFCGWIHVPRVPSPNALAALVEHYINSTCAQNVYAVDFDCYTGRFSIDRRQGCLRFDLLGCSDEHSILKTMGFAAVDYVYGQWAAQNTQQTKLPSNMLMDSILRPEVESETVGESALVEVEEGAYEPTSLAPVVTHQMQPTLIQKDVNDLLVAQFRGDVARIRIVPGMYSPDLLACAIAQELTWADGCDHYEGSYDLIKGRYSFCNEEGCPFGLLFALSTITALLAFEPVNLSGSAHYTSNAKRGIQPPFANRRFTNQLYAVDADVHQFKYRIRKVSVFQAPILRVERAGPKRLRCFTRLRHTRHDHDDREVKGVAHGLQVGDFVRIDGPKEKLGGVRSVPAWNGWHVVDRVDSAYCFELALRLIDPGDVDAKGNLPPGNVVIHNFEPFFIHFPGVWSSMDDLMGFVHTQTCGVSYLGEDLWDFFQPCDLFINVEEFCEGENSRICKLTDSGPHQKYSYKTLHSFVRIPMRVQFGAFPITHHLRRKRFLFNTMDFSKLTIRLVDKCGNPINFHGRDHCLTFRFLLES